MTKKIIYCDLNVSVTELMETMTEKKIRHMLIMSNDELKGIVSIGDVVNHLIENYKEENENLRNYINNS
jgi:predicted transcriptional regulator